MTGKELLKGIFDKYELENAYIEWANYRKKLTSYIIKKTKAGKKFAIIGIGEANDIDLGRLIEHADSITLLDINEEAMKKAVEKYGLVNNRKIQCVKYDLIGATYDDYLRLANICAKDFRKYGLSWTPNKTSGDYINGIDTIFKKALNTNACIAENKFDYTVMIGVHSQLLGVVSHIWEVALEAAKKYDTTVFTRIDQANKILMPKINREIIEMTSEKVFFGVELCERERNKPVQGASQAIKDINKTAHPEISKVREKRFVWPLRKDLSYVMDVLDIKLKKR